MTTPQDSTNTTERAPRPSESPPDEPRRAPGAGGQSAMPPRRTWLWFALILLANILLVRFIVPGPEAPLEVPYTFFKEQVRAGNVEAIYSQGDSVEGRFEEPVTYPPKGEGSSEPGSTPSRTSKMFTTVLPSFVDPGLEELLKARDTA
jgi:cell division protease FtsH